MSHCVASVGSIKAAMLAIMRSLVVVSLILAGPAFADPPPLPLPWVKLSEVYYTPSQVQLYGAGNGEFQPPYNAVYVQTHLPNGSNYGPQTEGVPITVDLTPFGVSSDAKVAWLSGLLIITHGSTQETAGIYVTFAAYGSPIDCTKYLGQVIETSTSGGQRSTFSTIVPLNEGKFQFCYHTSTPGAWPNNSSYGINLSLQAWGR